MATLKPFAAMRPRPELAGRICELPYDVMSEEEARRIAAGNPLSFLHVSRPEIDLPPSADAHGSEAYAKAKENYDRLLARGALSQDACPCFYLYRQVMGGHSQTGLVAVASCPEYLAGVIRKHELTRPDKEEDRIRHMEALNSQTGPVFLTYPAAPSIDAFVSKRAAGSPSIDFTAADGVRHTAWTVGDPADIRFVEEAFAGIPFLYIADGHHRSAAAARVFQSRNGTGNSAYFLSVIFPHNQVRILPYNRVVKDLNGLTPAQLLERLNGVFLSSSPGRAVPARRHEVCLFLSGTWHTLNFRPRFADTPDPVGKLDVALLQDHVLGPIFGIADPRTSNRIQFVGGIRGTDELERWVNEGNHACAFSLFPTGIEELMTVANAGGIMPPKSTWFEPKLRDGMFCHGI